MHCVQAELGYGDIPYTGRIPDSILPHLCGTDLRRGQEQGYSGNGYYSSSHGYWFFG